MKNRHIIILMCAIILSSCANQEKPQTQKTEPETEPTVVTLTSEQTKNAGIKVAVLQEQKVQGNLHVNGMIEPTPESLHTISLPMEGFVRSIRVVAGMIVKKGDILATVEDAAYIQLQQDYLTAKSKLEFFAADYNRQKELYATQSNSQRTYQESKAAWEEQKILLKALSEKLKLIGVNPDALNEHNISRAITLAAPVGGHLSRVNINPGKYANSSDILFEIINQSGQYVKLSVFENDAKLLQVGQQVAYHTTAEPDHIMRARISLINRNLNEDRTVEVRCTPEASSTGLMPGTFVNAEIAMNNRVATVIPDGGIVSWQGRSYVFVQQAANTYRMQAVETGEQLNGFTVLKTAISSACVTSNAYALLGMLKNKSED